MCETCGETFRSATMHHLDTAPECGECRNERLSAYIACGWATADEPSEPCDHSEASWAEFPGEARRYTCDECDEDLTETLR